MFTRESKKRFVVLVAVAAFVFSFASLPGCIYVNAESSEPFEYKGKISLASDLETKQYEAANFSGVDVGAHFDVLITPGDDFSLVIDAEEKTHKIMRVYVRNNVLDLGFSRSVRNPGDVRVKIVMPRLEYLSTSGAADVQVRRGFEVDNLRLDSSGATEINIDIDAGTMVADLSGAAQVDIEGRGENLKLSGSGASEFNAKDFLLADADIDLSGASDARVNVSNYLTLDLSGASNVRCERAPAKIYSDNSGLSDVDC